MPTFPRGRKRARNVIWFLLGTYVALWGFWIYWQFQPSQQTTIIVARLDGAAPEHSLSDEVIADLRRSTEPSDHIQIVAARTSITEEQGPEAASRMGTPLIGRRHEASFVWWGRRDESATNAKIVAHFEPIRVRRLLSVVSPRGEYNVPTALPIATYAPFVIPIEELRQFTFQPKFAKDMRLRSFYVLGLASLLTGNFARAKDYFDKSYDETAGELIPQVLVSRGFAEIGLARERSKTFEKSDAKLARELLRNAKSDCEKAVSLGEPTGHFCVGQANLEVGQVMLALLVQANQQSWSVWSDWILEEDAVVDLDKAIQECSRTIELLPKSTASYGCRAHGNFILGVREAGFRLEHSPSPKSAMYYTRAIEDWSHIIAVDQHDFDALQRRALAFLMLDDYPKAESDLTASLKLDDSYPLRFFWRGIARGKMNHLKEAASDFEAATDLAHEYAPAWCALGRSRKLLGEKYAAREALLRCQQLSWQGSGLRKEADDLLQDLQ